MLSSNVPIETLLRLKCFSFSLLTKFRKFQVLLNFLIVNFKFEVIYQNTQNNWQSLSLQHFYYMVNEFDLIYCSRMLAENLCDS